jgi:hypothetical protein
MLDRVRDRLGRARSRLTNLAWTGQWAAARAIATPWMKRELEAGRAKLGKARHEHVMIDRDVLDACVREAAPPGVPFETVVLRGSESAFSAGNDIGDFLDARDATSVARFINGAATCPKPLIAAVCGPAVGIGTTILAHFELVYAGDNALFSTPIVDLGLSPEAGSKTSFTPMAWRTQLSPSSAMMPNRRSQSAASNFWNRVP